MVLVVGATGRLGSRIARQLLAEEHPVRAFVRRGSDYRALERTGAEIVFGDLRQPSTIAQACRGMAAVVSTASAATRSGPDHLRSVDVDGNRALIEAAREEGVEQFVFLSALGADVASPIPLLRAKARTEQALIESGLAYTLLQPDFLMDVWLVPLVLGPVRAGRPVSVVGAGQTRRAFVAAADVAAFAVAAIGHPLARNRTLQIGGPEALSLLDVVERCAAILGRVIPVRHLGRGQSVPGLPESASTLLTMLDAQESLLDSHELADAFGVTLTSLEAWLQGQLGEDA